MSGYDKPFGDDQFATTPAVPTAALADTTPLTPAMERFRSCRWRKAAEDGMPECCGHRDVLPLTGANGFDAAAWCPECGFYKLRRTPKKRDDFGVRY